MRTDQQVNEIPWPGDACIICLESGELSLEHIIPNALHGILTCRFLCRNCNSLFGGKIDASAKSDPAIRTAALALEKTVPNLVAKIEEGQRYLIHTDVAMLQGLKRGNVFQGRWEKMPDGTRVAPEDQAIAALRGMMQAESLNDCDIEETISGYMAADLGETVAMSPMLAAKKLAAHLAGPDLQAPSADPLFFVKIAYEFAALLVGSAIYDRTPQLDELRNTLKNLRRGSDSFQVEVLDADEAAPFHGIAFEGNASHAIFQIRLFGKSAYKVHLKGIAVEHKPIAYTHDLESGEHWHNLADVEAAA